jgi:hypothetical protein
MRQQLIQSAIKEIVRVQGAYKILYAPALGGLILFVGSAFDTLNILKIKAICERWKIGFDVVY